MVVPDGARVGIGIGAHGSGPLLRLVAVYANTCRRHAGVNSIVVVVAAILHQLIGKL